MTTFLKVTNNAISTLNGAVNNSVTTWALQAGDGAKFPSTYPFDVTCQSEIARCTSRSTDTLTVTRGVQGTSAASHADGVAVELRMTAKHIDDITGMFTSGKIVTFEGEVVVHEGNVVYI